jgi:hypothetical protein
LLSPSGSSTQPCLPLRKTFVILSLSLSLPFLQIDSSSLRRSSRAIDGSNYLGE